MKGFIKLRLVDGHGERPLFLAVDQIASIAAYDAYRPNYRSWITTKDGMRYQAIESAAEVAAAIDETEAS